MKYSDILPAHVYSVKFDEVRECEFNGQHLAIVLKKNVDGKTAIVAPLTSASNGEGTTKVNVGKISTLPTNLRTRDSFVVYNQVRTVNSSRFIALKDEQGNRMPSPVTPALFNQVLSLCLGEIGGAIKNADAVDYHFSRYTETTIKELVEYSYEIKRLISKDTGKENKEKVEEIVTKMQFLNRYNIYDQTLLEPQDRKGEFPDFIAEVLSGKILEKVFS